MTSAAKAIGLWSGVGLVVANMIGTGVLTTTGFMAMDLAPSHILLAWLVGGVVALAGARAYAALAQAIPRSGGEYRYLSDLMHPSAGYLAGWASLLLGFSAPIALAALAAGAFTQTLGLAVNDRHVAAGIIVAVTVMHAVDLRSSKVGQDVLAAVKAILLVGLVVLGLALGHNAWPTWRPAAAAGGLPVQPFFTSLVYIAFCYSGWNATIYAAEEFAAPRRDVPRAMMLGCAAVMVGYLVINWVFVANLAPADFGAWLGDDTDRDRITVAHVLAGKLVGGAGAKIMSVLIVLWLVSTVSAMGLVGPRVCAAMARDGYLPRVLAGRAGRPPAASVALQGGLAVVIVYTHHFRQVLANVGAILVLVSALTVLALFRVQLDRRYAEKPGPFALGCAVVYVVMSGWMLYFAVSGSERVVLFQLGPTLYLVPGALLWIGGVVAAAAVAYAVTVVARPRPSSG